MIVAEKARARRLIDAACAAVDHAYAGVPSEEISEQFSRVFAAETPGQNRIVTAAEAMDRAFAVIVQRTTSRGPDGIMTGFVDLDAMLGGLQAGEMTILAARPSMGKTALAMHIAMHAARAGHRVLVFSLEMSTLKITERMIANLSSVPLSQILSGDLDNVEMRQVEETLDRVRQLPLAIDDTAGLRVGQLSARARAHAGRQGAGLIVVDYLQLMGSTVKESRERQVAEMSAGLKTLAKTLGVPVLALSQLNRNVETRAIPTPRLSDLRDSGSIEQDADIVLMLHKHEDGPMKGKAEVVIAKHRNGPTGHVYLRFEGQCCRFTDALG